MLPGAFRASSRTFTIALAMLTAVLVLSIIVYPERAFQSSLQGLTLWWTIVFPSLLPFLIISELMTGFGAVRGIGTLLEPFMRFLFRIPGVGGWSIALGVIAGMPAGASIASKLRIEKRISREEGERLLALSHMASPFFLMTVLGVGFLQSPETGASVAVIHYLSAIGVGIIMRFVVRSPKPDVHTLSADRKAKETSVPLWKKVILTMHQARLEDGRGFGKLLGDSVTNSIQLLMMIGGYMIVFSVLVGVMDTIGLTRLLQAALTVSFPDISFENQVQSVISGLMELHLGAYRLSALPVTETFMAALLGMALAWSGIAVHFQVKTAIRNTDFRFHTFIMSRMIHAVLAFVMTLLLWKPISEWFGRSMPVFAPKSTENVWSPAALSSWHVWAELPSRLLQLGIGIGSIIVISLFLSLFRRKASTY